MDYYEFILKVLKVYQVDIFNVLSSWYIIRKKAKVNEVKNSGVKEPQKQIKEDC